MVIEWRKKSDDLFTHFCCNLQRGLSYIHMSGLFEQTSQDCQLWERVRELHLKHAGPEEFLIFIWEELGGDDLPLVQPGLTVGLEDAPAEERLVRGLEVGALAEVQRHAEVDVPDHIRPAHVKEYDVPHGVSEDGTCISIEPDSISSGLFLNRSLSGCGRGSAN